MNKTRDDMTVHLERAVLVSVALPHRPWSGDDPLDELLGAGASGSSTSAWTAWPVTSAGAAWSVAAGASYGELNEQVGRSL